MKDAWQKAKEDRKRNKTDDHPAADAPVAPAASTEHQDKTEKDKAPHDSIRSMLSELGPALVGRNEDDKRLDKIEKRLKRIEDILTEQGHPAEDIK